jgi:hypothetical protein
LNSTSDHPNLEILMHFHFSRAFRNDGPWGYAGLMAVLRTLRQNDVYIPVVILERWEMV